MLTGHTVILLRWLQQDDMPESLVWVVFLTTTEVNLAIFCVSIPMLGPILGPVLGCLRRRGWKSKLSPTPPYDRSTSTWSSRSRRKARRDDTIGLDTLCSNGWEGERSHDVSVMANKDRDGPDESRDGSEVSITMSAQKPAELPSREDRYRSIKVQKQWTVQHV